jgi:predicted glycoside hydrolase/deacetylase ChbG (UPF0249 family)
MRPVRFIVNADDLGISSQVNSATFDLMKKGRVTSATLLANAPAVKEAAARIGEFPKYSFGIHLNLTEFQPLTKNLALAPLLNESGCFAGEQTLFNIHIGSVLRNAVYYEWLAQIERLRKLGVELTHIDSHNHAHTCPLLFPVLKRIQKVSGIRRVRLNMRKSGIEGRLWNFAIRYVYRTSTTTSATDLKGLIQTSGANIKSGETVELSVHPGNPAYEDETRMLQKDWMSRLPFKIELISYRDVAIPRGSS